MRDTLTTMEVARLFRVSPTSVYRWMRAGRLTPVGQTPGGQHRFDKEQVEAMLGGPSEPPG